MKKPMVKGKCAICRQELGKTALRNHLLKEHMAEGPAAESCYLIRAEGRYNKNYWFYFDIPLDSTFLEIDLFLRRIWLECCDHLSEFRGIDMDEPVGTLPVGSKIEHVYDFGSTSTTLLTILAADKREASAKAVRFLGRNLAPVFPCTVCGQPATLICDECGWEGDNPFFCENCITGHEHDDMLIPVTNSPRMGVCGYCGESDIFD